MIKRLLKRGAWILGFELSRKQEVSPAHANRPVGNMKSFLEDVKTRGLTCHTLMDIGANKSEWSQLFLEVYSRANCILLEPLKECETALKDFVKSHPSSSYYLCAAGSENKKSIITIWDDLYGSSLLPASDQSKLSTGKQREIEVVQLDTFINEHHLPIPEIVKIDVQGFELEVLKGGQCLFDKVELFILEVSLYSFDDVPGMPEFFEVVEYLFKKGYVAYDFPGFLRRPLDGALGQCDIAFVKKDSVLRKSNKWT